MQGTNIMSTMAFRSSRREKRVTLNITPLIDVLFLLLIFFMVTGTFKRAGELELRLPESTSSTPAEEGGEIRNVELILTESGLLQLDGEDITFRDLKSHLVTIHSEEPAQGLLIKAEAGVRHGQVVRVLDIVRDAGFPGIGLGTKMTSEHDEIDGTSD